MVGYLAGDDLDRESSFFTSPQQGKNGPKYVIVTKGQAISKRIEFWLMHMFYRFWGVI